MVSPQAHATALELQDLVRRGYESQDVDYKGPGSWKTWNSDQKAELIRDMMAMGNSDRPGWIILGVAEGTGAGWMHVGLTDVEAKSFDPSDIGKKVKRQSDPEVRFSVRRAEVDGKAYIAIRTEPFGSVPHVCKTSSGTVLDEGAIYVRTEAAETSKVTTAEQMRRLVDRGIQVHADLIVGRIASLVQEAGVVGVRVTAAGQSEQWSDHIIQARRTAGRQ